MKGNIYTKEIFINNKPLILTNSAEKYISKNIQSAGYLLLSGAFPRNLRLAKKHLEQLTSLGAIIHDVSPEAFEELLQENYTEIVAAGGLVINNEEKLLMIFRKGFWDLPKGKLDDEESIMECAVREVKEETGLVNVIADQKLQTSYHLYDERDSTILKRTEWYSMNSGNQKLTPQLEEGIIVAKWVDKKEASLLVKQSYAIIKQLVTKYFINN